MLFCYNNNGDDMKKILSLIFIALIAYFGFTYRNDITNFILTEFINEKLIITYENNTYTKSNTKNYQMIDNFYPKNKQDIINLFFTAINGGWNNIVFFCSDDYDTCLEDIKSLVNEDQEINKINNYVHPYNSYEKIYLTYNSLGKINIDIERLYNDADIELLNNKVALISDEIINNEMSKKEQIRAVHDYIINNTVYDTLSADEVENNKELTNKEVHKATGALLDGLAICGGYSDAMAIFLNNLNIENYKLNSDKHVWNYVNLNDSWLHLDLTWDDPVTNTNENVLIYSFFLITEEELKILDPKDHDYY